MNLPLLSLIGTQARSYSGWGFLLVASLLWPGSSR